MPRRWPPTAPPRARTSTRRRPTVNTCPASSCAAPSRRPPRAGSGLRVDVRAGDVAAGPAAQVHVDEARRAFLARLQPLRRGGRPHLHVAAVAEVAVVA